MSTVTVTGNVVATPELRFTSSGKAVANFTVAENRKRGEESVTSFFDVVAWEQMAENISECIDKGVRVVVTGRLDQRTWDSDAGKRSKIEIIADEVAPSLRWATATITKNERTDQ